MKKELVLALVIAISLGGAMIAMAANSANQGDSQNTDDKGVNCEKLCADGGCLYVCSDPANDVIHCDAADYVGPVEGADDCWCEEGSTTCLLPLEDATA